MAKHKKSQNQNTSARQKQKFYATVINSRTPVIHRKDISDWQVAKQSALKTDLPRFDRLQELFDYIMDDAHLSAQLQLRKSKVLRSEYALIHDNGDTDDKATDAFVSMPVTRQLIGHILDAQFYGYSLVELAPQYNNPDPLVPVLIDRRHIDPKNGILLIDTSDTTGIDYRHLSEYGKYILEFRGSGLGLLDKAVPHVLFKRFAQACWSEFCEVCGMPPRVIKTNTQDPNLRQQYLDMLANYGSGANGVIDIDDEMIFVSTNASNGESYENLIRLCSNEISLLINGAVLGQDTRYGSNSKEETSADLNDEIVEADMNYVEVAMNTIVLPALVQLGFVPQGLIFRFREQEDTSQLFQQTIQAAQYFDIDPKWVREKFGIEVLGVRQMGGFLGSPSEEQDKDSKKKDNKDKEPEQEENNEEKKRKENSYSSYFDPFV